MTRGKHSGRKTNRVVRTPATKVAKLQKQMQNRRLPTQDLKPQARGY